jgi:hypothetical protein
MVKLAVLIVELDWGLDGGRETSALEEDGGPENGNRHGRREKKQNR